MMTMTAVLGLVLVALGSVALVAVVGAAVLGATGIIAAERAAEGALSYLQFSSQRRGILIAALVGTIGVGVFHTVEFVGPGSATTLSYP